ncbi:MAG: isoprenylcysteine carboxylmethyltransferase family protein [bacterium]|nr:isoprenylcysteine carboxylmethyltransferase family protein [bacterium]
MWLIAATFGFAPFGPGPVQIVSTPVAIVFNLALVALFGIQHTIMARPAFKARWTQIVSPAIERSIFTLLSGLLMALMMWLWQPLSSVLWSVETPALRIAMIGAQALGWTYMLSATFAIDHFELFGLRQVQRNLKGDDTPSPPLVKRLMYRFDRHPLMSGILVALWCAPTVTLGYLVLALGLTTYIILGVAIEERDLVRAHGAGYVEYRSKVGSLVPSFVRKNG